MPLISTEGWNIAPEVQNAISSRHPVVALESTLICHGLPWPTNLETAKKAEAAVRAEGAIPATIAILNGKPTIGMSEDQLETLAQTPGVMKASRRDLGVAVGLRRTAATTVSATMTLAHAVGIAVFATGGIGGAHLRTNSQMPLDISADLTELSRTPVLVVSAGAKSILDVPQTLELLETFGVPVLGYRTDDFPAFYVGGGAGSVSYRVESAEEAAMVFAAHRKLGRSGAILAQRVDDDVAIPPEVFESAMKQADQEAKNRDIQGAQLTPFLLSRLAELTVGKTLLANQMLIVANARLAAKTALFLAGQP
ncbi:MAG: pseudouridine-5'-phosphate glycosidase [Fimbriiglobus sp.]